MNELSFEEEKNWMDLVIENISKAVRHWVDNHPSGLVTVAIDELSKSTGLSVGLLHWIKNYSGAGDRPNPSLDNVNAIMKAINCKATFAPLHNFKVFSFKI